MANERELVTDTNTKHPGSTGNDEEEEVEPQAQEHEQVEEYSQLVERLRTLLSNQGGGNVDQIRKLIIQRLPETACGAEDAIAPIRANLWSVMLLGLRPEDLNNQHELVSSSLHGRSSEEDHAAGLMHFPKEDQRVLAADIKRTRQAYAMFKREDVMQLVSQILERYCVGHGIRYKQGQNELIAPFVMLQDPPLPLPVLGLLFESFMSRFVSRWFVDDEIEALLVSYRVFRVLLFYLDPGLANKLDEADFVPELYATAWLITLFSRNLSMELVVRLWDVYLAVNDPALVFFLLAALLVRNRVTILGVEEAHMMPETIQSLTVEDKNDLEELIIQAREMLRKIPACFLQTVRSCCSDQCNVPLDTSRSLFCESVRCASISPAELLERMTTRRPEMLAAGDVDGVEDDGNHSPCPMRPGKVDTVSLDIRPLHDYEASGVGHLGKSLRLDPYLLEMDDVLEKWLEHFDGTKGTHVCLVDSLHPTPTPNVKPSLSVGRNNSVGGSGDANRPGPKSTGQQKQQSQQQQKGMTASNSGRNRNKSTGDGSSNSAKSTTTSLGKMIEDPLWRRLLFGEGEPSSPVGIDRDAVDADADDVDWVQLSDNNSKDNGNHAEAGKGGVEDSEEDAGGGFGAARRFAQKLHARGFPYVSILEGGMEGIVEHLLQEGSPLEPTVIDHDPEMYQRWKEAHAHRLAAAHPPEGEGQQRASASRAGKAFSWRGTSGRRASDSSDGGNGVDRGDPATFGGDDQQGQGHRARGRKGAGGAGERLGGRGDVAWENGSDLAQGSSSDVKPTKVGVLDRLGLVGVRDGVTLGVGTVARTGAWAVRGGAGMIIPSSLSTDRAGGGRGNSEDSGNIWRGGGDDGVDSHVGGGSVGDDGGSSEVVAGGGLGDGSEVKAIIGAMKTAQAGVRDGISRGVRTGAWAVKEGAGRIINAGALANVGGHANGAEASSVDGDGNVRGGGGYHPLGGGRGRTGGVASAGGGGIAGIAEVRGGETTHSGRVAVGDECSMDGTNEEELMVALKTAEANGHVAAARVLRCRLGFIRGQALSAQALDSSKNSGRRGSSCSDGTAPSSGM